MQEYKDLATSTFNFNFNNYIDLVSTRYSNFYDEHHVFFEINTNEIIESTIREALELYAINELGISEDVIEILKRNGCEGCLREFNHCIENAQGGFLINQVGVFVSSSSISLLSIWTGPGSIVMGTGALFGGTILNGFNYASNSWTCRNDYRYCIRTSGCIGGGDGEDGPLPFGE